MKRTIHWYLKREEWLRLKFNALTPRHTLDKFFSLRFFKRPNIERMKSSSFVSETIGVSVSFVINENWRSCIFEDLEDGQYYYFLSDEDIQYDKLCTESYGFCLSELLRDYCEVEDYPPYKQKCYRINFDSYPIKTTHQGTFYDLVLNNRRNLDEVFDTLALGKKAVRITVVNKIPVSYNTAYECLDYQPIYSYDIENVENA